MRDNIWFTSRELEDGIECLKAATVELREEAGSKNPVKPREQLEELARRIDVLVNEADVILKALA